MGEVGRKPKEEISWKPGKEKPSKRRERAAL